MARNTSVTQSQIARAIRAARREGCAAVEVLGAIRIYLDEAPIAALPSQPEGDEAECHEIFGTRTE